MQWCSQRLRLRPLQNSDIDNYFAIHHDPRTNMFNPSGGIKTKAEAKTRLAHDLAHWDANQFGLWAIAESAAPKAILGYGGLSYKNYNEVVRLNLYYRLSPDAWGKGYATELAKFSVQFAFSTLNQSALFGLVRPNNVPSIRVLEKCGMKKWGELDDVPNESPSLIYCIKNKKM